MDTDSLQFSSFIESNTCDERFPNLLVRTIISSETEDIELISDSVDVYKESSSASVKLDDDSLNESSVLSDPRKIESLNKNVNYLFMFFQLCL